MGIAAKVKRTWPFIFIVFLWFAFSFPYFFKGSVPFPSDYLVSFFPPWNAQYGMPVKNNAMPDVITQIYPWKKLTIDIWKSGNVPLWNPYSFSGTPHAANYQSAVFSPVNLLFFVFPFLDAWSIMVLLQPLVAGVGMYLFLGSLVRSPVGAAIGAVGFMFCGFLTTWMAYGTLGWAVSFLPWALWGVNRSGAVVSVSVALSFLSGHFQISVYVLAAISFYILYRRKFHLLWSVLLGLVLAAPQLLLTVDAYQASTRNLDIGKIEVIPWQYLVTLFSPDFYGNPVTRNDWFGHYAEWSSYVGIVPLILGFLALIKKAKDGRLFFITLGILAILFAYPTPLNDLLFRLRLPALSTSASSRIIVLLSFSLAGLAGFGFDDLVAYWKKRNIRTVAAYSLAFMIAAAGVWVILFTANPFEADKLIVAKRNLFLPTAFAGAALSMIFIGFWKKRFVSKIALFGLLAILAFDAYRFATKWMPFDPRQYVYPEVSSLSFLKERVGNDRVFGNIGNESGGMFSLPLIEGYDAMYQGRYGQFINAAATGLANPGGRSVVLFDKQGRFKTIALKLLGVRYIYHRMSDGRNSWTFPYWEYQDQGTMNILYNDEKYQIFEYTEAYPRAFLASSYKVTKDDWDILHTLFDPGFDSRNTLILEEKPDVEPLAGQGAAEIVSYKPTKVVIRTTSETPKLLFLSDVFDPGWKAAIDGNQTKVYRADYDFRAVAVPAGDHTIEFVYFPRKLSYGFLLSGAAVILLGINLFRHKK